MSHAPVTHTLRSPLHAPLIVLKRFEAITALACGGVYGLGLARNLFESQPQRFTFFGAWPGVLLTVLLCGGATVGVLHLLRKLFPPVSASATFAPLALLLPLISVLSAKVHLLRAQTLLLGALALFILLFFAAENAESAESKGHLPCPPAPLPPNLKFEVWGLGFLFFLLISLYFRTLGPTVGEADPFEFQIGAARLGIAHGSGYPLLMLLGKLFTLLPMGGTLAFRANLTSAFFAALAAVGVARLARRLGAAPLAAFTAGLAFGVSPTLWARATELEAYTLNAAFLAALLYLCFELVDERPVLRPKGVLRNVPYSAYLLAFLFGLGLTNHLTTLIAAPACLLAAPIAYRRWRIANRIPPVNENHLARSPAPLLPTLRFGLWSLGFFLLGLSVYLYLPLRWPAAHHGELLSLNRFLHIVKGGESTGEFNPALPFTDAVRYGSLFQKIVDQYGWPGIALAAVGAGALAFRKGTRWPLALLVLTYAGHVFFIMAYHTRDPDWSDFFIPLHLIAAVLMGVGVQAIRNAQFAMHNSPCLSNLSLCILYSAFCLVPLHSLWLTLPHVDRSRNWSNYRLGQYTLSYPLASSAAILVDPARMAPLYYLQVVEGVRPDLDIVLLPDEASYRAALDERAAAGQTVYLARYLPGLGSAYSLRSVGPLAEVSPNPFTASPEIAHPLSALLAANIRLLGYNADALSVAAPSALRLALFWRADASAPPGDNYLVSLRLSDTSGNVLWQGSGNVPVGGLYPTNAWKPGETISDFYSIPINAELAPGNYHLQVGLFLPFQVSADSGWTDVAPVTVLPPTESPSPPHPVRMQFGPHWLMGYAAPESAAPGSRIAVTLYWLRGAGSDSVTAFGETRSLARWPLEAIIPLEYKLTAPAGGDLLPLVVDSGQPARCGWLSSSSPACALTSIQLLGEAVAEGAVNFDNQLILRGAVIETPVVERGGSVNVTLEWQGLQTITEDYTVFVQLVGPDGRLHGQVDFYPVKGTLATSHWTPGQVIRDPYTVVVPADAPPGDYTVHVGMYLLATLERLPVLNADGMPMDDRVALTGLTVK